MGQSLGSGERARHPPDSAPMTAQRQAFRQRRKKNNAAAGGRAMVAQTAPSAIAEENAAKNCY